MCIRDRIKTANAETEKVRKGLNQIRDWKRWIDQNRAYFFASEGIKEFANNVPSWGFRYCLVVSRRDRMDEISNQLRGEMQSETRVTIMTLSLIHIFFEIDKSDKKTDYRGIKNERSRIWKQ